MFDSENEGPMILHNLGNGPVLTFPFRHLCAMEKEVAYFTLGMLLSH
jgi:hypothetical protein